MNITVYKLLNQSSDLLHSLWELRDTFERYSDDWFRVERIRTKSYNRYIRRYDWATVYSPKSELPESGDSARSLAPVAALPGTGSHQQEEQGSNSDKPIRKQSGYPAIPEEDIFAPLDRDGRLKHNRKKQRAEQGSGSTPDVLHVEYFDGVEIVHHVMCWSIPGSMQA